ncbi:2-keto-4-pentenoate hydratase [Mycolicibacterium novocastrense]|uniref:2-keto-4-pentenoate hydratase n=1 Tax=Mycolicibacterium novocastrense TaxID=59813 RepID=UPI0009E92211|nr:fumarylacetoacetate hydrolase family protein [Mycolicibacterium novocastrense]
MIDADAAEAKKPAAQLDVDKLAAFLDHAVSTAIATPQLSLSHSLTLDDAYAVQASGVSLREQRGDRVVGVKLGFTSKAKAEQMGLSDVVIGVLHDSMEIARDEVTDLSRWVHPRIEPEVAFRLGKDIKPTDTETEILAAVQQIAPALEIIDSRYEDFKFSLTDVVADNTSAAGFVVGEWLPFDEFVAVHDLGDLAVRLAVDGETVQTGTSADVLGNPLNSVQAAARMARKYDLKLSSGSIILAGAATAAVALSAGSVITASVAGLGAVSFRSTSPRPATSTEAGEKASHGHGR